MRVDVRAKWQGMGGELGGEVETTDVEQVISSMDSLSDDWARMRQAVCLDHFKRGTLTKAEYQRRADCLDELLSRQRTLVTALSAGTETTQEQMRGLSDALSNCR